MLVRHLAVGFAAKRLRPGVSLGTAVFAALLSDLLWCLFLLAGIERVEIGSGRGAANYFLPVNIAYSHSLLMGLVWAVLFGGAYAYVRGDRGGAWLMFAAVVSHWFLDWIAHWADMPLAPGLSRHFGLGLWTSLSATLLVEGGLSLLAATLYLRATRPRRRAGIYVFWIVLALVALAWYGNIAGPPPANPRAAPAASLVFFTLIVGWAYWIDRLRAPTSSYAKIRG